MKQGPLHSGAIPSVLGKHHNGAINKWPSLVNGSSIDPNKDLPSESLDNENLYAVSIYTREVISKPKISEGKILYELFSEVYLTDKKYFLGSNIQRGSLGAVSRTYKQPLAFDPSIDSSLCPEGYLNEGFNWLIYWIPRKQGRYKITNPKSDVPFYVVENEITISEIKNEALKIPFFFKKNVEEEVVVLRVGTPLFTLEFIEEAKSD